MNSRSLLNLFVLAARVVLGAIFVFASLDKIHDPDGFSRAILNYRIIESSLFVSLAATFIPWTELVAGFCLVLGVYRRGSSCLILVLLFLFIAAISMALLHNLDISCGCFTQDPGRDSVGIARLLEDIGLAILAFFILSGSAVQDTTKSSERTP